MDLRRRRRPRPGQRATSPADEGRIPDKKEAQQALAAMIRTLGDGTYVARIRRRSMSGSSAGSARWRRRFARRRFATTRTV